MGSIVSCVSNIMYLSEKISLYLTCTGLICCLVLTFVVTLGMGIGLGYNYCFVDLKTKFKYVPAHYKYPGSPRWPYTREGIQEQPAGEVAEDDNLRTRMTPPEMVIVPHSSPSSPSHDFFLFVNTTLQTTTAYSISFPDGDPSNDSSNETSVDETTSSEPTSNEPTTTVEPTKVPESTSEAPDSSLIETSTEGQPEISDEIDEPTPEAPINNTDPSSRRVKKLVIPISGLDLISLLSKLRAENKNYSLQIVTT